MAKRRHRSRGGYTPPSETRFYAPTRPRVAFSFVGPLPPYRGGVYDRHSAPPALDHPAVARHSRYLMRTVLTDTHPRNQTRAGLDVSRRAVFRSRTRYDPWSLDRMSVSAPLYERNFICARRSIRREVLFANRGVGKGARSPRRLTANSKVRC